MTEATAIRYPLNHGWECVGNKCFCLHQRYDTPVCLETAYQLQLMLERAAAA